MYGNYQRLRLIFSFLYALAVFPALVVALFHLLIPRRGLIVTEYIPASVTAIDSPRAFVQALLCFEWFLFCDRRRANPFASSPFHPSALLQLPRPASFPHSCVGAILIAAEGHSSVF